MLHISIECGFSYTLLPMEEEEAVKKVASFCELKKCIAECA